MPAQKKIRPSFLSLLARPQAECYRPRPHRGDTATISEGHYAPASLRRAGRNTVIGPAGHIPHEPTIRRQTPRRLRRQLVLRRSRVTLVPNATPRLFATDASARDTRPAIRYQRLRQSPPALPQHVSRVLGPDRSRGNSPKFPLPAYPAPSYALSEFSPLRCSGAGRAARELAQVSPPGFPGPKLCAVKMPFADDSGVHYVHSVHQVHIMAFTLAPVFKVQAPGLFAPMQLSLPPALRGAPMEHLSVPADTTSRSCRSSEKPEPRL
jgi:hypothetical protein